MNHHPTVPAYIAAADASVRAQLKAVRALIRKTVPDAKEGISYGMPAYTWKSKPLFYFAAMKQHIGLYPTSGPIVACRDLLEGLSTSKGCVRIPHGEPIPTQIVVALLKERKREIRGL